MNQPIEQRDYQIRIVNKTVDAFLKENCKSILIESPTGSGKTLIALQALKRLKEIKPNFTFGWVAMRHKLLQQAKIENERVGVQDITFISMFDDSPPKVNVMITDEAQHDAAATCAALHKTMEAELSIGLTATPFRTDRIKLAYEKVIHDCGVRFLIEQGYLSNFHQYVIPKWSPTEVATQYAAEQPRWGKSIVYMLTKELCWETEKALKNLGVTCAVILGSDGQEKREEIYSKFEDGRIQVLINVYLLTEGFDCPDLNTVFVRDSGKLCTMQMAGRVLRKDPNNKDKIANIVQAETTPFPYTKVAKAKREFVFMPEATGILADTKWRSLEPGPQVEMVSNLVREQILPIPVTLPAYLEKGTGRIYATRHGIRFVRNPRRNRPFGPERDRR